MSDLVDGTRDKPPEEVEALSSAVRPAFAAGDAVPGLSSWVLDRRLGGGGFGEVWLAKHAWDAEQKPRAVKFCTDPAAKNRLVTHEQNVVRRVMKYAGKHPNVVPLLDCNLDGDIPWLMYEFVEGGTLADAMRGWRALPVPKRLGRAVRVLHAIAGALGTFHRFDPPLVHRDMKPHNVLMAGSVPRITDFGIGGVVVRPNDGPDTGSLTAHAARLPSALHNAGTRLYAPAEQLFGSPPDPHDDVYALGVIAYQMVLADLTVVPGADAALELRDLKVPGELAALIVASVAMNADRRPKDATVWEASLAVLLQKSQKQPGRADTSVTGSKPILLPEPESTARSEGHPPRSGDNDFAVPVPEPTAGLPARTVPSPLSPPLPVALELPPVPPPPVARPVRDDRKPARPTSPGRYVAMAVGGVVVLALVAALVIVLLPSGKQTEPSQVSVKSDPKGDDAKGTATSPNGNGSKGGSDGSQVPKKEPEPKNEPEPKKPPEPKVGLPKAGDTREVEIAPGVKMTFCWVPPGTAMLGSPKGEAERLPSEVEHEYTSQGFWLGKYEVTQAEWKAVMGDNPSQFDGTKDNKAKGLDTSRFPVESVTWDRISGEGKYVGEGFLNKINHGVIPNPIDP